MKFFLIAFIVFFVSSCSDPRAKDKEILVNLELQYGDMTTFEAECFINIFDDAIDDDDLWDWMVAESLSTNPTISSSAPTKFEKEIGIMLLTSLSKIRDECGFDYWEVMESRDLAMSN
tara:strand:+ start:182 stop:535 length:354 start_codon:yes stop_codon:yes gene_type:complete